jgi:hypothetical protein
MNRRSATRMLCAWPAPVKYERNRSQNECQAKPRQPHLQKLRPPVAFGRDADVIAAGEVDLGGKKGRGEGDQGHGREDAWAARL